MIRQRLRVAARQLRALQGRRSFAQCGEDLILNHLLTGVLSIPRPRYVDVGAHDPVELSNTYYFYRQGCRGVCIEPNPILFERFKVFRRRDKLLNVGIGPSNAELEFYSLEPSTLSTFSESKANEYVSRGLALLSSRARVSIMPLSDVVSIHCDGCPDLVSIDVEGLDLEVLESLDLRVNRPAVICIETLDYVTLEKDVKIDSVLKGASYRLYADTFINGIYVSEEAWAGRPNRSAE